MSEVAIRLDKPKRPVSLRRDDTDFVVALQPEDVIVFEIQTHAPCAKYATDFVGRL
jgi:hypothetical protein